LFFYIYKNHISLLITTYIVLTNILSIENINDNLILDLVVFNIKINLSFLRMLYFFNLVLTLFYIKIYLDNLEIFGLFYTLINFHYDY